eukprot:SAG11_NODE_57_length_19200_cov_18.288417_4_plen_57_part_00
MLGDPPASPVAAPKCAPRSVASGSVFAAAAAAAEILRRCRKWRRHVKWMALYFDNP